MKIITNIAFLALLSACTNRPANQQSGTENVVDQLTDTLCFLRTEGIGNQDSTKLTFIINNDQVKGSFNWLPYEKDTRKGTIAGIKKGDIVKATWTYMQEGITDSIQVEFKLEDNIVRQKGSKVDPNTGKEILDFTSEYKRTFVKVSCQN